MPTLLCCCPRYAMLGLGGPDQTGQHLSSLSCRPPRPGGEQSIFPSLRLPWRASAAPAPAAPPTGSFEPAPAAWDSSPPPALHGTRSTAAPGQHAWHQQSGSMNRHYQPNQLEIFPAASWRRNTGAAVQHRYQPESAAVRYCTTSHSQMHTSSPSVVSPPVLPRQMHKPNPVSSSTLAGATSALGDKWCPHTRARPPH